MPSSCPYCTSSLCQSDGLVTTAQHSTHGSLEKNSFAEVLLKKIYRSNLSNLDNFFVLFIIMTFPVAIRALSTPITSATMELYERIIRDLPPTPSKFHYIFNLRDLSRIYHGLFLTTPERFSDPTNFVRVWRNECMRVFYDRLTNDKDRDLVSEHMKELLQQYFKSHAEVKLKKPPKFGNPEVAESKPGLYSFYHLAHSACQ